MYTFWQTNMSLAENPELHLENWRDFPASHVCLREYVHKKRNIVPLLQCKNVGRSPLTFKRLGFIQRLKISEWFTVYVEMAVFLLKTYC